MDFLDWVSVLSLIIGLMNLDLNEKQVNNLEEHLSKQDEQLLKKIIDQNEEIIRLIKELKK